MDVAITEMRANLGHWLARARQGEEVVVTNRGVPVARLVGLDATPPLERLIQEGVVARPAPASRPTATGHRRPRARRSLAEVVSEQRR